MLRTTRGVTRGGPSGTSMKFDSTSNSSAPPPTLPADMRATVAATGVPANCFPSWMHTIMRPEAASEACEEAPSTISSIPSASSPAKTPRAYQSDIADKCEKENCLVVLPTGVFCMLHGKGTVHTWLFMHTWAENEDEEAITARWG